MVLRMGEIQPKHLAGTESSIFPSLWSIPSLWRGSVAVEGLRVDSVAIEDSIVVKKLG
jgi:hypothetical protein